MRAFAVMLSMVFLLSTIITGCATTPRPEQATSLSAAVSPAWSMRASDDEIIVAVSPARQTLQLAGTAGTLIGAGISASVDAKYKKIILAALDGYDAGEFFESLLSARLSESIGDKSKRVNPLGSTAGFQSKREAEQARYSTLAKSGHDMVLDLKMSYGIFGAEGILVTKLDGRLLSLPRGRELWDNTVVASVAPILASDKLADPTKRLMPNFTSPRLKVDQEAIAQWTEDGALLRARIEESISGVVSALLFDLGLSEEADGAYYMAKLTLQQKRFAPAKALFEKALRLDPEMVDAKNGITVALAHGGDVDGAIAAAKALAESAPDYGPAQYNLAWWYAIEKEDAASARPYYNRALALDMPDEKKLAEALSKN